jgi:hypothetical protein
VALPVKGLAAKTIEEAGEKPVPVGVIALRNIAFVADGKKLTLDQVPTIDPGNGQPKGAVLFFAVRKQGNDRVLEVYGLGEKPLGRATLAKTATADAAAKPIGMKLVGIDKNAGHADVAVILGGAYQGTLQFGPTE